MAYITLNKDNFFYNLDIIANKTKNIDKIALVLKDNAYGHGLCEIAKLAFEYGITKAVVSLNEEALQIQEYFDYILVLADVPTKASKKIRYTINDIKKINLYPKNTLVELKVNSGMNRNGIEPEELDEALSQIKKHGLKIEAIFTHHGCADELNGYFEFQKKNFELIKQKSPKNLRFHSCNSAALFREDDFCEDMVRVGIAAYGCLELKDEICKLDLKPVLSVYAKYISKRHIAYDECVGYGATYISKKDEEDVSNYDFGYGHGFLRVCSNVYKTPVGVEIAGKISMDSSSFISNEDELLIFDDAKEVAKYAKTISYEVLTSLKSNIKRVII